MQTAVPLPEASQDPSQSRERLWLLAFCIALAVALGLLRWHDWGQVQRDEEKRLGALASAAERNLSRRLQAVHSALTGVRDDRPEWAEGGVTLGASRRMRALQAAMPGVSHMALIDARGAVVAASRLDVDTAALRSVLLQSPERADPRELQVHVVPGLLVSAVSVVASVVVTDALGRYDGLVLAVLDPSYFVSVLQPLLYAEDMRALVVHDNGTLLAQSPQLPDRIGTSLLSADSLFSRHRASGWPASVQQGRAQVSGSERLAVLQDLRPLTAPMARPLVLAISREPSAVHAAWRRQSGLYLAAYVALVTLAGGAVLAQQRRRREQAQRDAEAERQRATDAERLALALAGADLALWDARLPSGETMVNQRWFTMLGHAEGEFDPRSSNWVERLHPDDRDAVLAAQQAHIDGVTPAYEATYRLRHKSGAWVWVLDRGRVVERDADGTARRMVGTHMDISERMQAQEAVRRSEQSLAITLNSIGDAVIATDPGGRVTRMNPAAERLTGWPLAEALGLPLRQVFRIYNARTREPVQDPVALVLARGEIVGLANDTVLIARGGGEHQIADSAAPIRSHSGSEVLGVVLVFSDVTEQYRTLQALRDREHQLAAITQALPGPVSRVDLEGRYLFANPVYERWFGLAPGAVLGRTQREVLGEQRWPSVEPHVRRAMAGETVVYESPLHSAADGWLQVLVTLVPDRDESGAVCGHFTIVTDITGLKRAEDELRRSEARLRMAGRVARMGGWQLDPAGPRISLTDESLALLGLDSASARLDFEAAMALVDGGDRERTRQLLQACLDTGAAFDTEIEVHTGDGHRRGLRVLGEAARDGGGRVVGLQGAIQDITEARQAQQQLRLLEACVARLNDVVLITEATPLHEPGPRIVFANPAFERLSGWSRDEVLGRSPRMLQGPMTDRAELERIGAALTAGQAVHAELINYSRLGEAYWIDLVVVPLPDASGQLTHFVAVQRDITERKHAEARLHDAQQALEATLEAVPDLLFEIDLDGRIHNHHSPRSELLLMPAEAFIGRRIAEVLPAEAAAVAMAAVQQAHAEGHSMGLQYPLPLAGGVHWFELSVSRKAVHPGARPRFIALARDISERRRADEARQVLERQLREAQKMESMGTLAGGIAHDFNNILPAILGNVELALGDLPNGHPAQLSLEQIKVAGLRARSLVQQILTFSRRQPQALKVQPLRPALEEALALLRATLPAGVRLDPRLSDEPMSVRADATQMQQVVMNLCTNAWHALPEGRGSIVVGLERLAGHDRLPEAAGDGPCAHLWVQDDGVGMDEQTLARIFDPFFTTKPVGQGTGLGLSVVHGIVNDHQGRMQVDSRPGLGSTFHVYLPLRAADPAEAPAVGAAVTGSAGRGQRVLYVDDDEVMVLMVQRLLERAGYEVEAISQAPQALARLIEDPMLCDLLVTDYNMPEVSGLDLCRQVLALRPDLPVIISSGYLSDTLRQQAEALGVHSLLKKEHTLDELPALVQRLLGAATA
jgi:PAS domain S-box-containing protein